MQKLGCLAAQRFNHYAMAVLIRDASEEKPVLLQQVEQLLEFGLVLGSSWVFLAHFETVVEGLLEV